MISLISFVIGFLIGFFHIEAKAFAVTVIAKFKKKP